MSSWILENAVTHAVAIVVITMVMGGAVIFGVLLLAVTIVPIGMNNLNS